ncbi:MAG: hypothetical protein P4L43_18670 [Syntrophobacteraceae bacterium]|nr:hypothetical protein [Syntrophobacteraceae bacterium]
MFELINRLKAQIIGHGLHSLRPHLFEGLKARYSAHEKLVDPFRVLPEKGRDLRSLRRLQIRVAPHFIGELVCNRPDPLHLKGSPEGIG